MSDTIEIGPHAEADVHRLFAFAKSVFAEFPGWNDRRVLDTLANDIVFVARERGQPAGYVALRHEEDGAVVVEQLFVAPGHERRGIAHTLLAYTEGYAIAQRARTLRIVVERDNRPARALYQRSGFVPVAAELFELALPYGS